MSLIERVTDRATRDDLPERAEPRTTNRWQFWWGVVCNRSSTGLFVAGILVIVPDSGTDNESLAIFKNLTLNRWRWSEINRPRRRGTCRHRRAILQWEGSKLTGKRRKNEMVPTTLGSLTLYSSLNRMERRRPAFLCRWYTWSFFFPKGSFLPKPLVLLWSNCHISSLPYFVKRGEKKLRALIQNFSPWSLQTRERIRLIFIFYFYGSRALSSFKFHKRKLIGFGMRRKRRDSFCI